MITESSSSGGTNSNRGNKIQSNKCQLISCTNSKTGVALGIMGPVGCSNAKKKKMSTFI